MLTRILGFALALIAVTTAAWGAPFHFTVTCDQRNFDAAYDAVLAAMQQKVGGQGAFQVSPGDIDPPQNLRARIDSRFGASATWYPGIGNHEAETAADMTWVRDEYSIGHSGRPPLKNATNQDGPAGTTETNYSWDYGTAHFIMLNEYWNGGTAAGSDVARDGDVIPTLRTWLAANIAATTKPVIIVFGHEPAFPFNRHVGDSLDLYAANRDAFWSLLESDQRVKAYITAHTHFYTKYRKPGGRVWQIDAGNAGNDGGDGKTFLDITIDDSNVRIDVWRDLGTGAYSKADTWSVPVTAPTPTTVDSPSQAKLLPDTQYVRVPGTVSAAFPGFFYLSDPNRVSGIRVNYPTHSFIAGAPLTITGTLRTSPDGERYIDYASHTTGTTGSVDPFGFTHRSLGGTDWLFNSGTGAGQRGVINAEGLNNIGTLVRVCGRVSYAGADHFYMDDGSGASDQAHQGVKVLTYGFQVPSVNSFVYFTGISSLYKFGSDYYRLIHASDGLTPKPLLAYNDCVWEATQPKAANVTTFGIGSTCPWPSTGRLIDFNSGQQTNVTVALTQNGGVTWQPSISGGGTDTNPDTDAYSVFGGICNLLGVIYYGSSGWYVDLEISGLDPAKSYEFVTTSNRNGSTYLDRLTKYTISGADSFTNASTPGATISGASTTFCTGYNTVNGYVARWTGIRPGTDGAFKVRAEATPAQNNAYAFDAFKIRQE